MKSIYPFILSACVLASTAYAQNGYVPGPRTSNFQHIVVIFQENRTPDNLFYALCFTQACSVNPNDSQYNIQTSGWANLRSGPTTPTPIALANTYDLNHAHSAFTGMCDLDPSPATAKWAAPSISLAVLSKVRCARRDRSISMSITQPARCNHIWI